MGFPRQVNVVAAPAVAGDFADHNYGARTSVDAGYFSFVTGPNGLTVGYFAWADSANRTVSNAGQGAPTGFVHREQQAIITTYLQDSTMVIAPGFQTTLFNQGSFWVTNNGASASAIGQTAYADYTKGSISFGAAGSPPTSASCTGGTVAKIVSASTGGALPIANTCTASISGTTMTVTAVGSGSVLAGGVAQTLAGGNSTTGVIDPNTMVVFQVSGTAGGIGVYTVSISQNIASTAVTLSGGGLTLTGANTSGVFAPGMTISGTNIPTGTTILAYGTATAGGAGTYLVSNAATTAATASTITAANMMFLTVDSSSTGSWNLNDLLVGAGIPTTGVLSYINQTGAQNANLSGLGGQGTYLVTGFYTAVTAEAIAVNSASSTKWIAQSVGLPGELVKMSSFLLG